MSFELSSLFTPAIQAAVFDFDGVLCDSVELKSRAFAEWVPQHYEHLREAFMTYHMGAYGVGRRLQLAHFFREIVGQPLDEAELDVEVERLSEINRRSIFNAPLFPGVPEFLERITASGAQISILSGTPQAELEALVAHHGLAAQMDYIIGTPTTKVEGLTTILRERELSTSQVVFFGDAEADWKAAHTVGVHFVYKPSQVAFPVAFEGPVLTDFRLVTA